MTKTSFWFAPDDVTSVTVTVVLAAIASVIKVALLVDPLGYSPEDIPIVKIWAGHSMKYLKMVDFWPMPTIAIAAGEWLEYTFKAPVECRLISLAMVLPDDEKFKATRRLHLGRLFVSGQPVSPKYEDVNSTGSVSPSPQPQSQQPTIATRALPADASFRAPQRILDFQLRNPSLVSGFAVHARKQEEAALQGRYLINATGLRIRNDLDSQRALGRFLVPRVSPPQSLSFSFANAQELSSVQLQFLTAAGAQSVGPERPTAQYLLPRIELLK